jgi:hypothetical protein
MKVKAVSPVEAVAVSAAVSILTFLPQARTPYLFSLEDNSACQSIKPFPLDIHVISETVRPIIEVPWATLL